MKKKRTKKITRPKAGQRAALAGTTGSAIPVCLPPLLSPEPTEEECRDADRMGIRYDID